MTISYSYPLLWFDVLFLTFYLLNFFSRLANNLILFGLRRDYSSFTYFFKTLASSGLPVDSIMSLRTSLCTSVSPSLFFTHRKKRSTFQHSSSFLFFPPRFISPYCDRKSIQMVPLSSGIKIRSTNCRNCSSLP